MSMNSGDSPRLYTRKAIAATMQRWRVGARIKRSHIICVSVAGLMLTQPAAAQVCAGILPGERIGNATILGAQSAAGGAFSPMWSGPEYAGLPPFCRVVARARPTRDSNIVIEVWLPERSLWNGRYLGTGNGGYAGALDYDALSGGLRRGYAVANTDMGTYPAGLGINYGAGNGQRDPVRDWGYRATHEMTLLAKALVERTYGNAPQKSFFVGCSTGGRQGLIEAQRYPQDYDAILAGAPAYNSTHLHSAWTGMDLIGRRLGLGMASAIRLWNQEILRSCAGRDGGAPGDRFLTNPMTCQVPPSSLACRPGQGDGCLQPDAVAALENLARGTRNPRTGELIYPAFAPGAPLDQRFDRPSNSVEPVTTDFHRWVFGPRWDATTFDFDRDMDRVNRMVGRHVNAMSTDLSAFAARGGKLIIFHGWEDTAVSPTDSLMYFDRINGGSVGRDQFARLFMAPGMGHCRGGPGFDGFGQTLEQPAAGSAADLFSALEDWVQHDRDPRMVISTRLPPRGQPMPQAGATPAATRPVCAYPAISTYVGGDPLSASSFECHPAEPARYELPAGRYLR